MSTAETMAYDAAVATAQKSKADFVREPSPLTTAEADIWDNSIVYFTQVYKEWERHLLLRIVKRIHALLVSYLNKEEQLLFSVYLQYDSNLDGVVAGGEAAQLLTAFEDKAAERSVIINRGDEDFANEDGTVTFLSLLRWFQTAHTKESSGYFAAFTDMMPSSNQTLMATERRLEELPLESIRRHLVGYRQLLEDVNQFVEENRLEQAFAAERAKGLVAAAEDFHKLVTNELIDEEKVMFEAFVQVDSSGDLLLQPAEVESLLRRIEPEATEEQIQTYMVDINMDEQESLTFVDLMQWWYDTAYVSGNVAAVRGKALLASVQSLAFDNKIDFWITGNWSGKRIWKLAQDRGQEGLEDLRDTYVRVMREVRCYKLQLELRKLELESGAL